MMFLSSKACFLLLCTIVIDEATAKKRLLQGKTKTKMSPIAPPTPFTVANPNPTPPPMTTPSPVKVPVPATTQGAQQQAQGGAGKNNGGGAQKNGAM